MNAKVYRHPLCGREGPASRRVRTRARPPVFRTWLFLFPWAALVVATPANVAPGPSSAQISQAWTNNAGGNVSDQKQPPVAGQNLRAARRGDREAQKILGDCYANGWGVPKDLMEAAGWYRRAAEQGHAGAQCRLGAMYYEGAGVTPNREASARWYRQAAEQGLAEAQEIMGGLCLRGDGVAQDYVQAALWYRRAADQQVARARFALGWLYENGRGVEADLGAAVRWYRAAAEQGNADAMGGLGLLFEAGKGVLRDYAEARMWYRRGADLGHAACQNNLGWMYEKGEGTVRDCAEAARWYRAAAERGCAAAQASLVQLCSLGDGVPADPAEVAKWYQTVIQTAQNDNSAEGFTALAWASLFMGAFPEAEASARRARGLAPEQIYAITRLGHALLLQGKRADALLVYGGYLKSADATAAADNARTLADEFSLLQRRFPDRQELLAGVAAELRLPGSVEPPPVRRETASPALSSEPGAPAGTTASPPAGQGKKGKKKHPKK